MAVVMRAEELVGLPHQSAVRLELFGLHGQVLGPVGKQVHVHRAGAPGSRSSFEA